MISVSLVIYNSMQSQIEAVLTSIKESNIVDKLYIIDNNPSIENQEFFNNCILSSIIEYISHNNTGYGSSHNIAIRKAIEVKSDYHIVLNPDIYFASNVLPELYNYMENNKDVGYVLPRVTYPNGDLQYLCKLLPTPFDSILRRFLPKTKSLKKINDRYELRMSGYNKIMNPPCLSGCFMFLRISTLVENNLFFDESYFMYFEDFDLMRQIHKVSKTIYYPYVSIVHNHAQESYKNKKMFMVHIKSAIHYFNKWGWFFDKERKKMNNQILGELK